MTLNRKLKALSGIARHIKQHPLASRYYLRGWLKFISWQLSQLYPHEIKKKFVGDTRYWAKRGWTGITGNIYTGLHDFSEMGFLLHFLRKDDLFIDAGANMGSYTLLAAGEAKANVLAFEPAVTTFERLKKNVLMNGLSEKVTLFNIGLGACRKWVMFSTTLDSVNHVAEKGNLFNTPYEKTALDSLDTILLDSDKKPVMVKIDVEGYEAEVLAGMKNLLDDSGLKVIIIELNTSGLRYGYKDEQVDSELRTAGFLPFTYYPHKRELIKLPSYINMNTIYLRDVPFVESRLSNAKKIKLFYQEF
ncbi:MAG TPA: FkbM family methyltransferase [Ferruginibacter sp.]|nr:FkbM family methyltransferase [Ferruginibacter sp.]